MPQHINFLYNRPRDRESKFLAQFSSRIKEGVSTIDISKTTIPKEGINVFIINLVLPKWILEEECQKFDRNHFVEEIPGVILKMLQEQKCFLLLDNSGEGPSNQEYLKRLHKISEKLDFNPSNIIWVHQNLIISDDYQRWLKPLISQRDEQVMNLYWHSFLVEAVENFQIKEIRNINTEQREHAFLCLNNIPRPERVLTVLLMKDLGVLENGLVSFRDKSATDPNTFENSIKVINERFPSFAYLEKYARDFQSKLPLELEGKSLSKRELVDSVNEGLYNQTYFSVITESEMSSGHVLRFTEKVLKPIFNFHPFIVLGNPNTLRLLREMGFKTFDGWIDESYDKILNKEERINALKSEILRLGSMPLTKLHKWYNDQSEILKYNHQHLLNQLPNWINYSMAGILKNRLFNLQSEAKTKQIKDFAFRQALRFNPSAKGFFETKDELIQLGDRLSENAEYAQANQIYQFAMDKAHPDIPSNVLHRLASNYFKLGLYEKALELSKKTVKIQPEAHWSFNLIAHIEHTINRAYFNSFRAYLNASAVCSAPEVSENYLNLAGNVYKESIQKGISSDPLRMKTFLKEKFKELDLNSGIESTNTYRSWIDSIIT